MTYDEEWANRIANQEITSRKPTLPARVAAAPPLAELLAFEDAHPFNDGRKASAIAKTFGSMRVVRYYQVLFAAIETREALELNPGLVHRLRAQRDRRATERASRTFTRR